MKIAIFSGEIPSSTFIESLIKGIAQYHEVLLFGVLTKKIDYKNANIKIIETPFSRLRNLSLNLFRSIRLLLKSPSEFKGLLKEIKRFPSNYDKRIWFTKFLPIILYKPDILHLQWARDVEFYSFLKDYGIKIVVGLRGAHINYTPVVDKRAEKEYLKNFPKADGFHAVSKAIAKLAINYGADGDKIKVIHSPIPQYMLQEFGDIRMKPNHPFRLISIGRFHWIKGMRYALDACAILKNEGFDFQYEIISTKPISEEAVYQISQLHLLDRVTVKPSIEQSELFSYMKTFDALLLPSLNEGIANVVLEAMAIGLPVVSTDCGGMSEVVIPNKTGWLVPTRNPKAIADAIIDISNTSLVDLNRIRTNAHNLIKEKFDYDNCIHQFLELYQTVNGSIE